MNRRVVFASALALAALTVASLVVGAAGVSISDALAALVGAGHSDIAHTVVLQIRLPRVVAGIVVGCALGVAGTVLQATFANPIVDSSLVGISTSSAVGAAAGLLIVPLAPQIPMLLGALAAGSLAMIVLTRVRATGLTFTLYGFALGSLAGAILAVIGSVSHGHNSRSLMSWLFGSLSLATWSAVLEVSGAVIIGALILMRQSTTLDISSLGAQSARHIGVDIKSAQRRWLLASLVLIAPTVALFGAIGFVGLAAPHLARRLGALRHRHVLPLSALIGANLVVAADTLSRTLTGATETPISITLALVGAPILFIALSRMRYDDN